MTVKRMDNVGIVVENLDAAIVFFTELGLELEGRMPIEGDWAGRGETGERYLDAAHPYAQDLDLFGKASLFELISAARTHIGESTLARWMLASWLSRVVSITGRIVGIRARAIAGAITARRST